MRDFDGDGYGDQNPAEGIEAGKDCDDQEPTIYIGTSFIWKV